MILFWWIFSCLILLAIGSFLNVVIYRYPIIIEQTWQQEAAAYLNTSAKTTEQPRFNLSFPSSHCPSCQHALRWWHNIPVISFLLLRGKCFFCQTTISMQYPLVEAFTVLLGCGILWQYGFCYASIIPIIACLLLLSMAVIDLKHQLLPDTLTLGLLWLGLLQNSIFHLIPITHAIYGAIIGYGVLWVIGKCYKLVRHQEGMGYGDYKLLATAGAWFGPYLVIIILLAASVLSLFISMFLLLSKKMQKDTPIPFGPFLAIAIYIVLYLQPQNVLTWFFGG